MRPAVSPGPKPHPQAVVPDEMVLVPGGRLRVTPTSEFPRAHDWNVASFALDREPVRVADYRSCVESGNCFPAPKGAECASWSDAEGEQPVSCMDWYRAVAYCNWVGKRLPSEVEWEHALRSAKGIVVHSHEWTSRSECFWEDGQCARVAVRGGDWDGRKGTAPELLLRGARYPWEYVAPLGMRCALGGDATTHGEPRDHRSWALVLGGGRLQRRPLDASCRVIDHNHPAHDCAPGLFCDRGVCHKEVALGGKCTSVACEDGAACFGIGADGYGVCRRATPPY